jgi:hypothetical protein
MTIITTNERNTFEQIANHHKHLIDEGEVIRIKNHYGQRVYYKVNDNMQLRPK